MVKTTPTPTKPAATPACASAYQPTRDDIIDDMLSLVLTLAPGFTAALAAQADAQIRARWGGDRPYIAARRGAGSSARNAAIRRDYWQNGERIPLLERRYGLSKSRIWEILKS